MNRKTSHHVSLRPRDIILLLRTLCIPMQLGVFAALWELMQPKIKIYAQTSILLLVIYMLVLIWLHSTYESLRVGHVRVVTLCTSQLLTLLLGDTFLFLLCTLSIRQLPSIPVFVLVFFLQFILSVIWCLLANKVYYSMTSNKQAAIVHFRESDLQDLLEVCHSKNHYDVLCTLDASSPNLSYDDVIGQISSAQAVFLGDIPNDLQALIIRYCVEHHKSVIIHPGFQSVMLSTARCRFLSNKPTLEFALRTPSFFHHFCKRTMDITVSALMLLVTSPILAAVALLVHFQDGGPALYRQMRLTKNGRVFELLKFRSMRIDAEKDGKPRLAAQNDDRITRVGKFIRATRLDELPQLWNILKGDMSLVGPRPERPEIAEQYSREIPEFNIRLQVKAGLTGYAQVHGKYNTTPQDKLKMDLMYISMQSIALDIKLILQTLQIMLRKESTEGINADQNTALRGSNDKSRSA